MDRAELMRQIRAGEYVVDPYAVAGAMLERRSVREALLPSEVLEPADLDERTAGRNESRTRSGLDAS